MKQLQGTSIQRDVNDIKEYLQNFYKEIQSGIPELEKISLESVCKGICLV